MSAGQIGHSTTLSGATTSTIGNIQTISGPNQTVDPIEISTMDSTDAAKEYIAGMSDAGEITFTVNYDGAAAGTADVLQTAFAARTAEVWTITYPDTSTDAATGFITALGKTTPLNDRISQDVTIKLTGVVTYADVYA